MNQLIQFNDKLMELPAGVLVALFAIAMGYVLRMAAFFPNNRIPLAVVIVTSLAFPLLQLCAYAEKGEDHIWLWVPRNVIIGVIIGFLAWAFHAQILKRFVDPHFFSDDEK